MKTVAIVQARMGSSRLPGKVLADISGKTMIERVLERVRGAHLVDKIVVATTNEPEDDILVKYLSGLKICDVFRGSMDDVLSRFYECAKVHEAEIIVRVTADDPLKDPDIIDKAISLIRLDPGLEYCSNTLDPSYPEGLDIEVIRFKALERAHVDAQLASEREHVTPYIWKRPTLFRIWNFKADRNLKDWRWTVDKPADIEFMRQIFNAFEAQPLVSYKDVIAWLDANPDVRKINSDTYRNEGYLKSIHMENQ
jgi:spore coat polysaccharide biosynthesis protein SpsF